MPLSADLAVAAPLYLELAPPEGAATEVVHLFFLRDEGALSCRGTGRFATDLFTLSVMHRPEDPDAPRVTLAPPRPAFVPRKASFCGVVAGLRLAAGPQDAPPPEALARLNAALGHVLEGDAPLAPVVAALDHLAMGLRFAGPPRAVSDRTGRRRARADTGVSRRRLVVTRRFRLLLGGLADDRQRLSDLALAAGYCDQSHMSASCRACAGQPPGALRAQATARRFGLSLQDSHLAGRLGLVISDQCTE